MTASLEEHFVRGSLRLRQKLKAEGRSSSPEGTLLKAEGRSSKPEGLLIKPRSGAPQALWPLNDCGGLISLSSPLQESAFKVFLRSLLLLTEALAILPGSIHAKHSPSGRNATPPYQNNQNFPQYAEGFE